MEIQKKREVEVGVDRRDRVICRLEKCLVLKNLELSRNALMGYFSTDGIYLSN